MELKDCSVIRHLHAILDAQPLDDRQIEPFDTVRGMFTEGPRLYGGSGSVKEPRADRLRNNGCIRGLFIPR